MCMEILHVPGKRMSTYCWTCLPFDTLVDMGSRLCHTRVCSFDVEECDILLDTISNDASHHGTGDQSAYITNSIQVWVDAISKYAISIFWSWSRYTISVDDFFSNCLDLVGRREVEGAFILVVTVIIKEIIPVEPVEIQVLGEFRECWCCCCLRDNSKNAENGSGLHVDLMYRWWSVLRILFYRKNCGRVCKRGVLGCSDNQLEGRLMYLYVRNPVSIVCPSQRHTHNSLKDDQVGLSIWGANCTTITSRYGSRESPMCLGYSCEYRVRRLYTQAKQERSTSEDEKLLLCCTT